jgi:nitroimidazol reductase NimA-like FMN-containing flavoprotein (pyridoxamine 5'-phosphate oxidase superfamily)
MVEQMASRDKLKHVGHKAYDAYTVYDLPFTIYDSRMNFPRTDRTSLKRLPKRGVYDRESVYGILDEGFICHVGFAIDGKPFVIPTGYAREDGRLYIHGSQASRMLRTLAGGIDVCVSVTLLDGLVLARSAFHHSMNYRSVVIFGRATVVEDKADKATALFAFSEHVIPGRWSEVREPTQQELAATTVLSLDLVEASAKIRSGPPIDDEEDYALPVWAGVIPLRLAAGEPIKDPRLPEAIQAPSYITDYKRGRV